MPTLNTLRTRGALILTIFVGVALLAFLLGDLTGVTTIFHRRQNRVGTVEGKNIDYQVFAAEDNNLAEIMQTLYGKSSLSTDEHDRVREMVWDSYIRRYAFEPGYRRLGLTVGEGEQIDMTKGQYISPIISMMFASRQTGALDRGAIRDFVANLDSDARMPRLWQYAKTEMVAERTMSKFIALVAAGGFVNDLEVAQGVTAANNSYSGGFAVVPYSSIADSLVEVSSSDVRRYYRQHRATFRRPASRDIEYVAFQIAPTEADYADAAAHVATIAEEFAADADPMQYASLNSQQRTDPAYYRADQLSGEAYDIAFGSRQGQMAGPTLTGDVYTISRVAGERMMPDSVGARHILLPTSRAAAADSLVRAIRGGADIFTLAPLYSLDPTVDLGRFAPEAMVEPFADAVTAAHVGEVFTVSTQFGTHVVQMTYRAPSVRKARVATITYTVEASPATRQTIYNKARDFAAAAAGSKAKFDAAVTETGESSRVATITQGERNVRGLDDSRELVRWSFNTKTGTVTPIMEIDQKYVVAVLTGAKNAGKADVRDVASEIAQKLRTDNKAQMLTAKVTGLGLDGIAALEGASKGEFTGMRFGTFYEPSIGVEPAVIGSVEGLAAGSLSKPIKGYSGVYVVSLDSVDTVAEGAEGAVTAADERVRLEAAAETSLPQRVMQAMMNTADITDNRAKFF